ncbi:hypothetical protein COB11_06700 [Candidatus Aerophobetes bacterium]|uniref:Transporter n=1 Tax=Aerophobetes bacterium TaxID=2030807 RepID=A0A2A4YDE3_UNCAE|nr:MAG: hypothetical protein COB11_06700 [Candidatus Aerophobetes bacterium]
MFAVVFCAHGYGLYMGNPYLPEYPEQGMFLSKDFPIGVKAGYQGVLVYERRLKLRGSSISTIPKRENLKYYQNLAMVSMSLYDRVELYTGLGASQFFQESPVDFSILHTMSHDNFVWEAGGRVLLIFWKSTAFGASAGYQRASPNMAWTTVDEAPGTTSNSKLSYSQWQVALSLSHKLGVISPYIGGAYSYVKYKVKTPIFTDLLGENNSSKTYENKQKISLVVGASLTATEVINLDIEAKTFGEKSLTVMGCIRF